MDDASLRATKGLTVAVWAVALGLLALTIAVLYWALLGPPAATIAGKSEQSGTAGLPYDILSGLEDQNSFHDLPIEVQIAGASLILLTENIEEDGKLRSTVTEVLLERPGTVSYYKVGDSFGRSGQPLRPNMSYGDGEIVFFTGSPAQMRYSAAHADGRLRTLGGVSIEHIRQLIAKNGGA